MEPSEAAFVRVAAAIRHLFHQLRALAERASPPAGGFTPSHRAVLESLSNGGPQTVPAMARARPVARQHIQVLVNDLTEMGLVRLLPNPAHKRSPLVELTRAGKRRFEQIRMAEKTLLSSIELPLSRQEMMELADRLESLSLCLRQWVDSGEGD